MDELDLLKQDWKKQDANLPNIKAKEIYPLLLKRSSSIVKWIFFISVAELALGVVLNLLLADHEFWQQVENIHLKNTTIVMYGLGYAISIFFIILFYKRYKAINVTDSASTLMKNILKILDKDGVFLSESHYLVSLIKTVQYDTIYHEHLRYYSLKSLNYLFKKYNLEIIHARKINTHGGSIRVYAARKNKFKINSSVKKILKFEKNYLNWKTFEGFRKKVVKSNLNLYSILKKLKEKNSPRYLKIFISTFILKI